MAAVYGTIRPRRVPAALSTPLPALMLLLFSSCGLAAGGAGVAAVISGGGTPGSAGGVTAAAPASMLPADGGPALASLKPGRAVLVEGSNPVKGLPGFGRNALSAIAGSYAIVSADASALLKVDVWFTRELLVTPGDWKDPSCRTPIPGFSIRAAPAGLDGSSLWSLSGREYTLFARMPPAFADPCAFMGIFAERFSFFYRYAERPEDVSFPAILEL